jgi:hypothetical protein
MPKVYAKNPGAMLTIGNFGVATDTEPVDVPESVARELLGLVSLEPEHTVEEIELAEREGKPLRDRRPVPAHPGVRVEGLAPETAPRLRRSTKPAEPAGEEK